MKKLMFLVFSSIVFVACSGNPVGPTPPPPPPVKKYLQAKFSPCCAASAPQTNAVTANVTLVVSVQDSAPISTVVMNITPNMVDGAGTTNNCVADSVWI